MPIAGGARQVKYYYRHQPVAVLDQAPPVQNTWYTILATTLDALLKRLTVRQDNTGATAEDLEVRITIDGDAMVATLNGRVSGTLYGIQLKTDDTELIDGNTNVGIESDLEGQSVLVEMRQTSDVGAGGRLRAWLHYATFEET